MAKLIVGLGNPGSGYRCTRHNVGHRVLARVATSAGVALRPHPAGGRYGEGRLRGEAVGLLEPGTAMNASGGAVARLLAERPLRAVASDLLVLLDDVDLPLGRLRLRPSGGDGGHRGLRDVIARLGSEDLPRLRVGIGRPPPGQDTVTYVLERFSAAEEDVLAGILPLAADAVADFVAVGASAAMGRWNAAPGGET